MTQTKPRTLFRKAAALAVSAALALLSVPALAADAPAAPTSLSASAADTTVTLKWATVKDATGYNIYADGDTTADYTPSTTQSDASHVTILSNGYTTFDISGLTYSATHSYTVSAVTAAGESATSSPVAITLLPQITGANVTAGNGAAQVSWNALTGVDSYEIDYGTASGEYSGEVDAIPGTGTGFILTGLDNSTIYYVKITAYDTAYNSSASSEMTVTPAASAYDVSPAKVTGYTISTNHGGENVSGTDDQYILMDITFDRAVTFKDKTAFTKELSAVFAGTDLEATTYSSEQTLSADGKTLHLKLHFPFAGYGQTLHVAATNMAGPFFTDLVDAATGKPIAFSPIDAIVNNGLDFKTVSQTVGSSSAAASVTKSVIRLDSATRGMYHVVLLKNGQPVGTADSYGANITSHFHLYLDSGSMKAYTAANVAANVASAIKSTFGANYTATADGDTFTVTENTAADGDVLDVLFVAYPRSADSGADVSALKTAIQNVESANLTGVESQLAIAKAMADSGYYLQSEVDAQTVALTALLQNSGSQPSDDSSSSAAQTLTDASQAGVQIAAAAGVLPDGTTMQAETLASGTAAYSAVQKALSGIGTQFVAYDITLTSNEVKVEPDGTVTVTLPIPDGFDSSRLAVYLINDDGSTQKMEGSVVGGSYVFTATHFSVYALVQTAAASDSSSTSSASSATSSSANPSTGSSTNTAPVAVAVSSLMLSAALALILRKKARRS